MPVWFSFCSYTVVCVAWYIASVTFVIYIYIYIYIYIFYIYLISIFQGLSKHSRLFGNPVRLLTGTLRQYSLSRAISLVALPNGPIRQLLQT